MGANITIACRDLQKGGQAKVSLAPYDKLVDLMHLDCADLASFVRLLGMPISKPADTL